MSLHHFVVHRAEPRCQTGPTDQPPKRGFPLSRVKVLESDDELHDAISHAIEFERDIVAKTSARVNTTKNLTRSVNCGRSIVTPRSGSGDDSHSEAV